MSCLVEVDFLPGDKVTVQGSAGYYHIASVELHGDADGWEEVYMLMEGALFVRHYCTELTLVERAPDNVTREGK